MAQEIGIITEQGDLGFGFDPLTKPDAKVYAEATKKETAPETVAVNEDKKD